MSLLNRRAGLLAAGPNAVRANAMRQQEALLGRARAPSVIGAPTSVITEENPLNEFGKGMTLFAKTLDARRQKQLENQLARQKMARDQMLASSLVNLRKAQAEQGAERLRITQREADLRDLASQRQFLLGQLQEAGKTERQRRDILARLKINEDKLANILDVQGLRNEGAMAVQGARNQGAMNVQNARNEGAMNVANVRKEGLLGAARIRADAAQSARAAKQFREMGDAEKRARGYRLSDRVQVRGDGREFVDKDFYLGPRANQAPVLPDILLPPNVGNLAEYGSGIGRTMQIGSNIFNAVFGSALDQTPDAEGFKLIDSVNNRAINIGQVLENSFGGRMTNFARVLTQDTLPTPKVAQTPRQYVSAAKNTANAFKGMLGVLDDVIDNEFSSREDVAAAKARKPEVKQLADFYSLLVRNTQGQTNGSGGADPSSNVPEADRIVFGGGPS